MRGGLPFRTIICYLRPRRALAHRGRLCLSKYRSQSSFTRTADSHRLSAYDHVHRVVARDRSGIVKMCLAQPCCLSSSPTQDIATPYPQGFSPAPSWWTSRRNTKTPCATFFGSNGPSRHERRPSPGLPATDAVSSEHFRPVARSGSMPTAVNSMPGSSTDA